MPGPLQRLSAIFSKVQPGEGTAVLILMLDLFLILTAYSILKVIREPLILTLEGGAELKSYSSAGQAILLILLIPAYGWFASRVPRMTLVNVVTAIFAGSFVVFWLLYQSGVEIGVAFFLWLGIFNMMVVAQFWSLAAELFSPSQGKRLFPLIAFGGTLGAIAGAWASGQIIKMFSNIAHPMLVSTGLLCVCILLTTLGKRAARAAPKEADAEEEDDAPLKKDGGFKLVLTVKYLRLIAIMIMIYNLVNTTGGYILDKVVAQTANAGAGGDEKAAGLIIGQFYSGFQTWVNIAAAVLQGLVVSRIVRFVGIRVALLILPAIALGGYVMIATIPILMWIKVAKISENGTDYSLHNTVRQILWLPTSREAKYKAKAAVDTFFVRFGDVLSAGLVFIGTSLALPPRMFAVVNVVAVLVWIVFAVLVGRENERQTKAKQLDTEKTGGEPRRLEPGAASTK